MVHLHEKLEATEVATATASLTLTFADRRRSRLRATLDDGREAAVMLTRGTVLRDGDRLREPESGLVVAVVAAPEFLSVARTDDGLLVCRAAYHLGNRHVPVQIGPDWLAYEHDHVLDAMVKAMGLVVRQEQRPFEPEAGGYGHAGVNDRHHGHAHDHDHTDDEPHDHHAS
jgi:urease accessory protein